jgi:GH24 family phage-related lysozyme (muramidase)
MGRGGCTEAVKLSAQGKKDAAAWVMRQNVKKGSGHEEGLTRRRLAEVAMLTKPEVKKTCIYQEYT